MLLAPARRALFGEVFVFHPLKGGDVERIDGAQRLRRTPQAGVMLLLHPATRTPTFNGGMIQHRAGGLLLRLALLLIISVIAAVAAQPGGRQFNNARHLAEQLPVVSGDQGTAFMLPELIAKPCPPFAIEVISRFIQ